jgi:two-component system, OmpR family, sensor histidine kinase BaeS
MRITLFRKISVCFFIVVIGSILIASVISNHMIDRKFNDHLMDEHNRKVSNLKNIIESLYDAKTGFSKLAYEELETYASMENFYIEVRNINNKVILATNKTRLDEKKSLDSIRQRSLDTKSSEYIEEKFELLKNKTRLGSIVIGHYGTFNVTEEDLGFKETLNKSHIISITAGLLFGLIVSLILSKQLINPISKLTGIANEMRNGNLAVRSEIVTDTLEIGELSKSINYLSETLQQQELLRKRLTSDMAHEIRTPLSTLQTHMEALIDGVWEPTTERFESCYDEILRLTKLVDNLKEVAKIEQSYLNLNKSIFNLSMEISKIVDSMKPQYEKKNLDIEFYSYYESNVTMDRDKFKQIMYNILSNSLKYSTENGHVSVMLYKEKDDINILIKDNGIGISPKDLPFIFERFYRGDVSRSRETGGTGIGLTIVKTLVEAHGGKVTVESEAGVGTSVRLIYPIENITLAKG